MKPSCSKITKTYFLLSVHAASVSIAAARKYNLAFVVDSQDTDGSPQGLVSNQFNLDAHELTGFDSCFTVSTYDSIDNDIEDLKNDIRDTEALGHFLGGVVMLAAHDFMDFDQNSESSPLGPDGCFDKNHPTNAGLAQTTWCPTCKLKLLYEENYSYLSRADFWIATAHAVIRQTSVGNVLNMKDNFLWGRKYIDSCPGSGDQLPTADGCDQTEAVFLERMGLEWRDAVALMGGHTLGRGTQHQGTWIGDDQETQMFDKRYYEEIFDKTWWPRNDERPAFD